MSEWRIEKFGTSFAIFEGERRVAYFYGATEDWTEAEAKANAERALAAAPPDPRKDLAALEELAKEIEMHCPCGARPESLNTHAHVPGCKVEALVQRLAEMRGAGR